MHNRLGDRLQVVGLEQCESVYDVAALNMPGRNAENQKFQDLYFAWVKHDDYHPRPPGPKWVAVRSYRPRGLSKRLTLRGVAKGNNQLFYIPASRFLSCLAQPFPRSAGWECEPNFSAPYTGVWLDFCGPLGREVLESVEALAKLPVAGPVPFAIALQIGRDHYSSKLIQAVKARPDVQAHICHMSQASASAYVRAQVLIDVFDRCRKNTTYSEVYHYYRIREGASPGPRIYLLGVMNP